MKKHMVEIEHNTWAKQAANMAMDTMDPTMKTVIMTRNWSMSDWTISRQ